MYYTVYKVTNKISGKFYIGTHKTKNLDDDYYGSGKYLKRAIEKHGIENFEKEILFVFDNYQDMFDKETEIVNEDFLAEENTYNLRIGGFGGWNYLNDGSEDHVARAKLGGINARKKSDKTCEKIYGKNWRSLNASKANATIKKMINADPDYFKTRNMANFSGKKHTKETKQKIGQANSIKQSGKSNSQYGTIWIYNLTLKRSKRIMKTDSIPEGWQKGRKIKFC